MLRDYLEDDGYEVCTASSSSEFFNIIDTKPVDIALLDLLMPEQDGISVLNQIRKRGDLPVIMISGRGDDVDRIIGMEAGADDYLAKPFQPRELSARIGAVLKRTKKNGFVQNDAVSTRIQFDDWILDRQQIQVFDTSGEAAGLTTKEFTVFEKLVLSAPAAVSREELFSLCHDEKMGKYDRAVDIQITRIRNKLGDTPGEQKYIRTVRGVGYLFCGDVSGV